jgi:hypothetical protein
MLQREWHQDVNNDLYIIRMVGKLTDSDDN